VGRGRGSGENGSENDALPLWMSLGWFQCSQNGLIKNILEPFLENSKRKTRGINDEVQ